MTEVPGYAVIRRVGAISLITAVVLAVAGCGGSVDEVSASSATSGSPAETAVSTAPASADPTQSTEADDGAATFYVYRDVDYPGNHFAPSGFMGDVGDIVVDPAYAGDVYEGTTALRVEYGAGGAGPNECGYAPPCRWAGVYWQEPPNNWGTNEALANSGYDLTDYTRLTFAARADRAVEMEFKVGGISGQFGDSLIYPRAIKVELTPEWRQYSIDLTDADLSHIIGGFVWAADWQDVSADTSGGVSFSLDEIRFEKQGGTSAG